MSQRAPVPSQLTSQVTVAESSSSSHKQNLRQECVHGSSTSESEQVSQRVEQGLRQLEAACQEVTEMVQQEPSSSSSAGRAAGCVSVDEDMQKSSSSAGDGVDASQYPPGFFVSVVIPVYNEVATIGEVIRRVEEAPFPKEIVVVDDHSSDGTQNELRRLEANPQLHVIYKPVNAGKGAALRTGFQQAAGAVIVIQDADLEYDPADIASLLGPILNDEADVVYGSRFLGDQPQDPSWIHRLGNALLTRSSNWTTGLKLTDMETCYKAFRRDALRGLPLEQDRFGFEPEVTAKLARRGYRFEERPIRYEARSYRDGKKIGIKDLFNALYCIWRYGYGE